MNRAHRRFLELAAASIDFELSRSEREELAVHLSTCDSCPQALDRMRADARAMRALPTRDVALERSFVILGRALRRRPDARPLRAVALAAVLALLVAGIAAIGSELLRRQDSPILDARPSTSALPQQTPFVRPSVTPTFWEAAAPLGLGRTGHTATAMLDGRVLVAGGVGASTVSSTEIFDPSLGTWSETTELSVARDRHVALAFFEEAVIVAGGYGSSGVVLAEMESYADGWSPLPPMFEARAEFTASIVPTRGVLFAGGFGVDGKPLASVERLDIDMEPIVSTVDPMSAPRARHTATSGLGLTGVVVIGGVGADGAPLATAEVFEYATSAWKTLPPMRVARVGHTATRLNDGRILVVGGLDADGRPVAAVEIYDPIANSWSEGPPLADARAFHGAMMLDGVNVLVIGGLGSDRSLATSELYDFLANDWLPAPPMLQSRSNVVLVRMANGSAMVIGREWTGGAGLPDVEFRRAVPIL